MADASETMVFWLVNALAWLGLALVTALPFLLLSRLRGGKGRARPRWAWGMPAVIALGCMAWAAQGQRGFEQDCRASRPAVATVPAGARPVGVEIDAPAGAPWSEFHWDALLESGLASFVDVAGVRWCAASSTPGGPLRRDCPAYDGASTEFIVHVRPAARVTHAWWPPEYRLVLEVEERGTGVVRARADELVFGGGWVGVYLRALHGGDQDFARLGCGYAGDAIGPWRPTLMSRPQFAAYRAADRALLGRAVAEATAAVRASRTEAGS